MQQKKYKWGFSSPSTASLETVANMVDNKQVSQSNQNPTLCLSQFIIPFSICLGQTFPLSVCLSLLSRSLSVSVRHTTLCLSQFIIPFSICLGQTYRSLSVSSHCQTITRLPFSDPIFPAPFPFQIVTFIHMVFPFTAIFPFSFRLEQSHSLLLFPALFPFQIVPFIHKVFPFEEAPAAYEMVKSGHLRGKVVIEVKPSQTL